MISNKKLIMQKKSKIDFIEQIVAFIVSNCIYNGHNAIMHS